MPPELSHINTRHQPFKRISASQIFKSELFIFHGSFLPHLVIAAAHVVSAAIKSVLYCRDHHKGHHQILHLAWGWVCNYISEIATLEFIHGAEKCKRSLTSSHNSFSPLCGFKRPHRWDSGSVLDQLKVSSFRLEPFLSCTIPSQNTLHRKANFSFAGIPSERFLVVGRSETGWGGRPRVIRNHCGEDVKNCDWDAENCQPPTIKLNMEEAGWHDHPRIANSTIKLNREEAFTGMIIHFDAEILGGCLHLE